MTQAGDGRRHLIARVFGILDAFTPEHPWLTLSELSRRTGLPIATVHRLTAQLVCEGALERNADGRYSIGIRLWQVALREPRNLQLRDGACRVLTRLQQSTGSTVLVSVLDKEDTVIIERLSGEGEGRRNGGRIGERCLARATPQGQLLMAYATAADDLTALEQQIRCRIQRTGMAVRYGRHAGEPFAVAAPVRNAAGMVIAALSVERPAGLRRTEPVIEAVRATAEAISRALRLPGEGPLSRALGEGAWDHGRFTASTAAASAVAAAAVRGCPGSRGASAPAE